MVRISADSTCDLSEELIEKYNITIAPLYVRVGEEERLDGVDVNPDDIFSYFDSTGKLCTTSALSIGDYAEHFKRLTAGGDSVVHVSISAEFSSCYQNACAAAENFTNVYVVDSRNLSTGHGHIVIEAALMAQQGLDAATIKERCDELAPRVDASFVLEHLNYLYKGGRCSGVAALGANILGIKPCIEVKDGKMVVGSKYRGSFEKVVKAYIRERLTARDDIIYDRIFITHTKCPEGIVDVARKCIEECGSFNEIIDTMAGCTVSSHCGPHCLGVLYIHKNKK